MPATAAVFARPTRLARTAYAAMLVAVAALVFLDHLSGSVNFVGDPDRLNAFLNFKLAEVRDIRSEGTAAAWNPHNLLGFNFRAAYWMFPGGNPDAAVYAAIPDALFLRAAGYMAFVLFAGALLASNAFLRSVFRDPLSCAVGACCYACAAFGLTRIGQGDSAFLTLVLLPFGMLALRRLKPSNFAACLAGLAAVLSVMFWLTFLQEVAYVVLLYAGYALFQAWNRRTIAPIILLGLAGAIATCAAVPRIVGVAEDFALFSRLSFRQTTNPVELLRLASDGIFGRFPTEVAAIGNRGYNVNEGLRIASSTIAFFVVAACLMLTRKTQFGIPLLACMLTLGAIVGSIGGVELGAGATLGALVLYVLAQRTSRQAVQLRFPPGAVAEMQFSLLVLCAICLIVLNSTAGALFHHLFFGVSFLHSRLSIAALLPSAILVAGVISGLCPPFRQRGRPYAMAIGLIGAAAGCGSVFAIHALNGPLSAMLPPLPIVSHMQLNAIELPKIVLSATFAIMALLMIAAGSRWRSASHIGVVAIASAIAADCTLFAQGKLFGPQTNTYPVAFRDGNNFNAPINVLSPPNELQRQALRKRVDNDHFRALLFGERSAFPENSAPHIAHFWGLRLLDGYPVLYDRVAALPWPSDMIGLRSIRLQDPERIPWALLSLMNTKYVLHVDAPLYFNASTANGRDLEEHLRVIENPLPVLPRHFFAESIVPRASGGARGLRPVEGLVATVLERNVVKLTWWSPWRAGQFGIERKDRSNPKFTELNRSFFLDTLSGIVNPRLSTGTSHHFRVRYVDAATGRESLSDEVVVDLPDETLRAPLLKSALPTEGGDLVVAWEAGPSSERVHLELKRGFLGQFEEVAILDSSLGIATLRGHGRDHLRVRLRSSRGIARSTHSNEIEIGTARNYGADLANALFPYDLRRQSSVEGLVAARSFPGDGSVNVEYKGDEVRVRVNAHTEDRFLVLNEPYHPRWHATANGKTLTILPANGFMRGLVIPAGTTEIYMQFLPLARFSTFLLFLSLAGAMFIFVCLSHQRYLRGE